MRFPSSLILAWLLNLLLPGLGHFYWREFSFGLFIYLIALLASVLYVAVFFVPLPWYAEFLILWLPILFYAFTFVDLARTVKLKRPSLNRSARSMIIMLLVGLVYQVVSPAAMLNFGWRNRPEIYTMQNNRLNPRFATGDILKADRLDYTVNIAFVDLPILHSFPERFDIVRFVDDGGRRRTGLIVGLPAEEVVIADGLLVVDGVPDVRDGPLGISLRGDWPLTLAGRYSILVATVNLGSVENVYEVQLTQLLGKVDKLF
ncbi:MAG: hypothetical protein OEV49_03225 [candidate division Zixibacteria bacterium]|nr:hypothetical protein [candidate division Zixibacteria bacterium]MDH3937086.1 hypothetical protein [candidate division Zixibacteria bacterium]MDH4033854.1 hypothetical protein [candidate division Zixibacteria bacterium]